MKPPKDTAAAAAPDTTGEPRNVAVTVLENRTKIGGAICAAGPCDFPLRKSDAEALQALGKVRIDGIF
jgi:predicted outer membrane repeat protein